MTTKLSPNPIGTIGQASLLNSGGFVCRIYFKWWDPSKGGWQETAGNTDIDNPNTGYADPGLAGNDNIPPGAPNNSVVRVCAYVALGDNAFGQEQFTYVSGSPNRANYVITGTTLDNDLKYEGITTAAGKG